MKTDPLILFLASGLPHLAIAEPFRSVEHGRVRGQILLIDDQIEGGSSNAMSII